MALTGPSEGVIIQGHGADRELLISVKYGEAVFRDGEAWMGSVLQEMEESACTGKQPDLRFYESAHFKCTGHYVWTAVTKSSKVI